MHNSGTFLEASRATVSQEPMASTRSIGPVVGPSSYQYRFSHQCRRLDNNHVDFEEDPYLEAADCLKRRNCETFPSHINEDHLHEIRKTGVRLVISRQKPGQATSLSRRTGVIVLCALLPLILIQAFERGQCLRGICSY